MRSYDVAIASLAIGASRKWTDNVIAQYSLPGVISVRRGVARRIERPALMLLALARELHVGMDMSVRQALSLAHELLQEGEGGGVRRGVLLIDVDRDALEGALDDRLREALESAPAPRRGRPPRRALLRAENENGNGASRR